MLYISISCEEVASIQERLQMDCKEMVKFNLSDELITEINWSDARDSACQLIDSSNANRIFHLEAEYDKAVDVANTILYNSDLDNRNVTRTGVTGDLGQDATIVDTTAIVQAMYDMNKNHLSVVG